ncbi:MAG: hypothetical protein M1817_002315 [Caeruleum heppii]|nr:MAG: hypothetical protein M1817_002315 [Caeruleum heppii]
MAIFEPELKPTYRSWKKKFRKMKLKFEAKIRESDQLFRDEQKANDTARRLAEENDQLLDLLLDVNSSIHIPPEHRFELRSPTSRTPPLNAVPALELDTAQKDHPEVARAALDLARGRITADEFASIHAAHTKPPTPKHAPPPETDAKDLRSLINLMEDTPHVDSSVLSPDQVPADLRASSPPTYFAPTHEDDYLFTLDSTIAEGRSTNASHIHSKSNHPTVERERERDFALKNPVSVYNWLRRNQPQVFLQDNETGAGGGGGGGGAVNTNATAVPDRVGNSTGGASSSHVSKPSRGASKRASTQNRTMASEPVEYIDEDGFVHGGYGELHGGGGSGGKGRKKRDEDGGYRPKGGGSRAPKRKREGEGSGVGSAGKKVRLSKGMAGGG